MYLGLYGGMMRGGNTDSTVVIGDGPIEAPPVVSKAWSAIAMHDEFWAPIEPKLRARRPRARERRDVHHRDPRARHRRSGSPATNVATDLGNPLGGAMVMLGAYAGTTGDRRARRARSKRCASRSRRTARNTSKRTNGRSAPGWDLLPAERAPRMGEERGACLTPTTTDDQEPRHRHDRRRPLQGMRSLHPRVPARRARDVDRGEPHGLPLPRAVPGLHRLRGVLVRVPRLRVRSVPLRQPVLTEVRAVTATAPARDRVLMEGSEALARAAIVAGLPLLRRLPDDAVHRGARALRQAASRRRRRVHQRRVGARSRRHGVGRALDRAPGPRPARPARASRSCRSRSRRSRSPSCRSSCSTWPAASRTTTRRRAAAGTATTATSCSRRKT